MIFFCFNRGEWAHWPKLCADPNVLLLLLSMSVFYQIYTYICHPIRSAANTRAAHTRIQNMMHEEETGYAAAAPKAPRIFR